MSILKSLSEYIDNKGLASVFARKEEDPAKLRAPLLKGIDKAREQYEEGRTRGPRRWWSVSNNVVQFTPKLGDRLVPINGSATNHIPAERFIEFLSRFREAVVGGEFDDELKGAKGADGHVAIPPARSRKNTISPEAAKARGRKAAEARARNKAARDAAATQDA